MNNKKNNEPLTVYIKNRRDSTKFKGFGSNQTFCLTENPVLRTAYFSYTKRYLQALRKIITIITLTFTLTSFSQNVTVDQIEKSVNQINLDTSLVRIEYDLNEIFNLTIDGSGFFKIWKSDSEITKIVQQAFLSFGITETVIYLEDEQPILIIEKEKHFIRDSQTKETNYEEEPILVFEEKIYCSNWDSDPIKVETKGDRILTEGICGISDYSGLLDKAKELIKE